MTMNDAVDAEQTEKLLAPLRHELLHPIEDMQDENDRQFITALARGLELLRCFTPKHQHLGNQELAQMTGLPNQPLLASHIPCRVWVISNKYLTQANFSFQLEFLRLVIRCCLTYRFALLLIHI